MSCQRCGGPTEGQNILRCDHRHFPDCIAFLKKGISELEPRAAFGDQCYQDRCENAYVEQSVLRRVKAERDALRKAYEDANAELELHATDRVNQRKQVAELQVELDNARKVVHDLDGLDSEPAELVRCLDCGANVPFGEPCPTCGLGS